METFTVNGVVFHNGCSFQKVGYEGDRAIIKIRPINGTFTSEEQVIYKSEKIENLTTNFGGGFEEWVKDNY